MFLIKRYVQITKVMFFNLSSILRVLKFSQIQILTFIFIQLGQFSFFFREVLPEK
jgi:hypothetical protein